MSSTRPTTARHPAPAPAPVPAPRRSLRLASAVAAALAASALAPAARADQFDWTGLGTTANWTNSFNWSTLTVPGNTGNDDVVFNGDGIARTTSVVNQPFFIDRLVVQDGTVGQVASFTLNAANNGLLTINDSIVNATPALQTFNVPIALADDIVVDNVGFAGDTGGGTMRFNGAVSLNDKFLFADAKAGSVIELNGPVAGSGGIVKRLGGTLVLDGNNDFTGGLEIRDGTVRFASGPNVGSRVNVISFNQTGAGLPTLRRTASGISVSNFQLLNGQGTLFADADWTITGTIGGGGTLAKDGQSPLTLTGQLSYGGGTNIKAGTLILGGSARLPDTTDVNISLGTAGLTYGDNMSDTIRSLNGFGRLTLGGFTRLTVGGGVYGGLVTGPGDLAVNNNGTLTLSNTNNDYTGGTTVQGGSGLALTNPFGNATGTGPVRIEAGGRLAGFGFSGSHVVVDGGTDGNTGFNAIVSPNGPGGDLTGTLTIASLDFDQGPGGEIRIDVDGGQGGTTIDRLVVVGNADLREGSLDLLRRGSNFFPNLGLSPTAIVTVGGTRTGVFASIDGVRVTDTLSLAVTYDGGNVNIRLADAIDTNLDGSRTFADFLALAPAYRTGVDDQTFVTGDLTGDGLTNLDDLTLLSNLYTQTITESQYATLFAASRQEWIDLRTLRGLPIPEPTAAALLGLGGVGLLRRRRR